MTHYAQLTAPAARSDQRYLIQSLTHQKYHQKHTAKQVGVHPSTISRELARYGQAYPNQPYQATSAQQLSKATPKRKPYKLQGTLEEAVLKGLRDQFSPEQISGVMALETGHKVISHEAIYSYIYRHQKAGNQELIACLRIRHKRRYKPRGVAQKRGPIPHRVGIEERPAIVETNTEIGHWAVRRCGGDTVIGADHDGVLLTLVERVTKYTIIVKLPSKQAAFLATRLIAVLLKCPLLVRSIPAAADRFDNGKEFTDHQRMSRLLKISIYFARPYHSCGPPLRERGLNENTNGLIREYIPKGCRISPIRPKDVPQRRTAWIQDQLNHRPRKTLGFLSPIQFALKQGIALQT